jgi:coenzyme Q-binding protein COQ10
LRCLSRYSPKQVFDVVAAVDLYEDFVPYCQRSQVLWTKGDELDAELEIGFKFFVERYISHVQLKAPHQIKVYFLPFPGHFIVTGLQLIE